MAKEKKTKVKSKRISQTTHKSASVSTDISEQLHLGESYISLILGAVVVFGLSIIFFIFVKESSFNKTTSALDQSTLPSVQEPSVKTYTLQEGEGLWDVAVKFYGDGYRWVDIAKANHLDENAADNVNPGTKLIIPNSK